MNGDPIAREAADLLSCLAAEHARGAGGMTMFPPGRWSSEARKRAHLIVVAVDAGLAKHLRYAEAEARLREVDHAG